MIYFSCLFEWNIKILEDSCDMGVAGPESLEIFEIWPKNCPPKQGIEPWPPGWESGVLSTRPRGLLHMKVFLLWIKLILMHIANLFSKCLVLCFCSVCYDPKTSKFRNWSNQKFKIFKIRLDILIPFVFLINKHIVIKF